MEVMGRIDCVVSAAAEEDKQEQEDEKINNNTVITLEMETTVTTATDPWMLFLYALKAPATRDKYIERLTKFLDFLGYAGTKEEKARAFADQQGQILSMHLTLF